MQRPKAMNHSLRLLPIAAAVCTLGLLGWIRTRAFAIGPALGVTIKRCILTELVPIRNLLLAHTSTALRARVAFVQNSATVLIDAAGEARVDVTASWRGRGRGRWRCW